MFSTHVNRFFSPVWEGDLQNSGKFWVHFWNEQKRQRCFFDRLYSLYFRLFHVRLCKILCFECSVLCVSLSKFLNVFLSILEANRIVLIRKIDSSNWLSNSSKKLIFKNLDLSGFFIGWQSCKTPLNACERVFTFARTHS